MNTKLKLIIIWQIIIILFAISVVVFSIKYNGLFQNRQLYPDQETWEEFKYFNAFWYPDYYQEFKDIEKLIINIYTLAIIPVASIGVIGLALRTNWGRTLSIISFTITSLFFVFAMVSVSLLQLSEVTHNIFVDVIAVVLICQAFIVFSVLSLIFLAKKQNIHLFR
jgi:hypothetical protein